MITRICKSCGKSFTTNANARMYCNSQCAKAEKKKQPILWTYTCCWCGQKFKAERKRKYCTEDCRLTANGRKKTGLMLERPDLSLTDVARLAKEEGLSYGKYCLKHDLY